MISLESPTLQTDLNHIRLLECFTSLAHGSQVPFGDLEAHARLIRRIEEQDSLRYEIELAVKGPEGWIPVRCDLVWGQLIPDAESSRRLFHASR